ncbi:MAG TPA: class I SAM-dependent methyltransferase [Jatrophihabitans sp.]|jgi:SAM-dependent methyltransferase
MSTDAQWSESMPEVYDSCLGPALFAPFAARLAAAARALSPRRVLELAAGTGILTAELARALPAAEITATDLNPAMVDWAAERLAGPRWLQADAQHLDLPDGCFDLVACQFGVMFFPDKPAAFAEAARVLAPGDTLLFSVWDAVETSDFPAAMMHSIAAVLPGHPPDFIVRVPHGYCDPDQLTADLRAGGLEPRGIDRIVLRGRSDSARMIARGFCLGTPLRFALQDRGSLEELTSALEDEMAARLGAGPVESALAAFVVTARTPA